MIGIVERAQARRDPFFIQRRVVEPADLLFAARYVLPLRIEVSNEASDRRVTAHDIVAQVVSNI